VQEAAFTRSTADFGPRAHNLERTHFARMILPYLAFPAAAALIVLHLRQGASSESVQTKAVIGLALLLLGLVMVRQFLTLLDNSRLSRSLGIFSHELEQRVAERTEELAVLNGVSRALSHCLTTDEVLQTGLGLACDATAVDGGVVWLKRAGDTELMAQRHLDATIAEQLDGLTKVDPEMRRALALRAPTLLDGSTMPALDDILGAKDGPGARLLTVPLMSRDSVLGALGLVLPPTAQCDEAKLQLAEAIGAQLGVAVENAEQYDNARYLAERDSVTGLHNHRSLHNRLEQELNRAQRTMGVFSIAMMDLDGFKLFNDTYGHPSGDDVLRAVASLLSAIVRDSDIVGRYGGDEFMAVLPDTGSQGAVDLSQRVRNALLESPYLAPDGEAIPLHLSFGIASYPADGRQVNELIGLADGNLYSSKQRGGDMITAAEESEEDRHGQGSGMFSVLDALVTAVDNKDRYTRHHSDDVTQFALAIAQQLSLSDESLRALRIAGLLHDVGKIGVPDRILRKPGRLTEDEMDVVKQHALLSEIIVKEVPNLTEVMAAVGSHHERWDGTGYPRGLKGAEIPFLGRILAVADAWSAMTTDRPYRKAMTPEAAREELVRGSGSQFDPTIVPAFLAVIDADVELLLAAG
jgi:diguanylate cyclase (GGDEF)-like protein